MGKIYDNVIQLIGNTPILHLHKMEEEEGLEANIYAKVEGFNPGGSVKDRAALNMIEAAEKEGKLKPGYLGTMNYDLISKKIFFFLFFLFLFRYSK